MPPHVLKNLPLLRYVVSLSLIASSLTEIALFFEVEQRSDVFVCILDCHSDLLCVTRGIF